MCREREREREREKDGDNEIESYRERERQGELLRGRDRSGDTEREREREQEEGRDRERKGGRGVEKSWGREERPFSRGFKKKTIYFHWFKQELQLTFPKGNCLCYTHFCFMYKNTRLTYMGNTLVMGEERERERANSLIQ